MIIRSWEGIVNPFFEIVWMFSGKTCEIGQKNREIVIFWEDSMREADVRMFSRRYAVRALGPGDMEVLMAFCGTNPGYFEAVGQALSRAELERSMTLLPPGKTLADKHFVGFYDGAGRLTSLVDLIEGYPDGETAYIGLFMTDGTRGGQGIGSAVIGELLDALRALGFARVRLAYGRDDPRAAHFWEKNGFRPLYGAAHEYGPMIVAQREL